MTCPDCKGTGTYVGLNTVEPCRACAESNDRDDWDNYSLRRGGPDGVQLRSIFGVPDGAGVIPTPTEPRNWAKPRAVTCTQCGRTRWAPLGGEGRCYCGYGGWRP